MNTTGTPLQPAIGITVVLDPVGRGVEGAAGKLLPLVYDELRRIAAMKMACGSAGHTLQPTALVHEAWMRLNSAGEERSWNGRAHFFNAAAEAIRRILIDHARRKARLKHGGNQQRLNVEDFDICASSPDEKVLLINEALELLECEHPERAEVVVLKFFGGMTNKEAAASMGISERTVNRHWICAKTWLFNRVGAQS
jgi:RNA polymerase sigma factor (TIGR02999 family)